MEKIFDQKSYDYFVWTPLGSGVKYRYFFSFKFTLMCKQVDIVTIIYHRGVIDTGGKFTTSVIDIGGNFPLVSLTLVENLPLVSKTPAVPVAKFAMHRWCTLTREFLHEFSGKN
jgi:hypothetical protein